MPFIIGDTERLVGWMVCSKTPFNRHALQDVFMCLEEVKIVAREGSLHDHAFGPNVSTQPFYHGKYGEACVHL